MSKSSHLIVIATAVARPGQEWILERALRDVAAPTRTQPGCVAFSLYRSKAEPSVFVGLEQWRSTDDHARHLQGAHVQTLMAAMEPALSEAPDIVEFEILDDA